ncbi:MAG: hypothetical protein OEM60_02655 [Gammaproteobacteria bacterium]|nr:hypothetical protein [Gammaproteobacteria bacterium]MDH3432739.1 hypothetical protein [Gammaproteobacteria bacterium]
MLTEHLRPILITNGVAVGLILLALWWPRLTRALFAVIFFAASLFNAYTALTTPEAYLDYAGMAALDIYRDFINGPFRAHTQTLVYLIAAGQMFVGALLTQEGFLCRLGVVGGVVFFVAIAPLGVGSAFPSTLLMAAALLLTNRQNS